MTYSIDDLKNIVIQEDLRSRCTFYPVLHLPIGHLAGVAYYDRDERYFHLVDRLSWVGPMPDIFGEWIVECISCDVRIRMGREADWDYETRPMRLSHLLKRIDGLA